MSGVAHGCCSLPIFLTATLVADASVLRSLLAATACCAAAYNMSVVCLCARLLATGTFFIVSFAYIACSKLV